MKLHDVIEQSLKIVSDAIVAEKADDLNEARNQIEKLHDLMHEPQDLPAVEQPEPAAEQPEPAEKPGIKPFEKPESKDGAGILSEPAEPAKKDTGVNEGSGKVSTPGESQNKEGAGVV